MREPWTLKLSKQAVGRAGEFQAAAIFERHGVVTTHVDVHGVDLWCETPSGRRVTVQVKTAQAPQKSDGHHQTPRYHFNVRLSEGCLADVYCFVALDLGLLRLFSGQELPSSMTKKMGSDKFTEPDMALDMRRYLY